MRSQVPPVCAHCQSTKSPLWRRGSNMEVLCNACGLYWKHHNAYRPLALKVAAARKTISSSGSNQDKAQSSTSFHSLAYTHPHSANQYYPNYNNNTTNNTQNSNTNYFRNMPPSTGRIRTSNVLLSRNLDDGNSSTDYFNRSKDFILPPLNYKNHNNFTRLNFPDPQANQRQLSAAQVLPNLKSVIESISDEKIFVTDPKDSSNDHMVSNNLKTPIKFITNKDATIYQGDHVSIRGSDSQVYFAILLDFWLTENGKKFCTFRWLLPQSKASLTATPLQDRFDLGPIHDRVESLECILDVFYSPYRDQMTADSIRRKFLLPSKSLSDPVIAVDPPLQLIKAIEYISQSQESDHQDIQMTSINSTNSSNNTESSEIAAKMLLSMT